jgi:4'-phosphopantetheinyl transferase
MPLHQSIEARTGFRIAVWRIEETVEELNKLTGYSYRGEMQLFKHENRRKEWLAVRMLLKTFFGIDGEIVYSPTGRPTLKNSSKIISVSHSGPFVALMLGGRGNLAIDIEVPSPKLTLLREKYLSTPELIEVVQRPEKVAVYWSAKETLYKLYEKKGLIFKTNLAVHPFELYEKGKVTGQIITAGIDKEFMLQYEFSEEFLLVYCIDDAV